MLGLLGGAASFLGLPGMLGLGAAGQNSGFFDRIGEGFNNVFGKDNAYMALGDPNDVTNVNPYTDSFMTMMGFGGQPGLFQNAQNQFSQASGATSDFLNNMDPTAAQNYFLGQSGNYRDIAGQNFAQYDTNRRAVADRLSQQAVDNISGHFGDAGPGALRSGAAGQAISEGAINPILQANTDIANMIGGQAGQLQGQGMGNIFNAFGQANQLGLSGRLAQQSMFNDQMQNLLGMGAGMSGQEWWQPTYAANPNHMSIPDLIGTGSDIAGTLLPLMMA
jgi:hypothetical protein